MNKRDYQKELDGIIRENGISGIRPSLLLHVCCAPCSSYCMEYLTRYFDITLLFYNPNMDSSTEYEKRKDELLRLVKEASFPVNTVVMPYEPQVFYDAVRGREEIPEGGERCFACYELRLECAAKYAACA